MTTKVLTLAFASSLLLAAPPVVEGPMVLLIAPPSSGKSTQAAAAARRLGVPVVSAEELIRSNQAVFEKIRRSGISGIEPETDPVLNQLFEERLEGGELAKGAILDGYPATKDHADFLAKMVNEGRLPNPVVIQLEIPDKLVRKRAADQPDRDTESVEQRLKDYHREMEFIHLYFPNADITTIDGSRKPGKVSKRISSVLKKRFKKK